jgi:hypothetical protein
VDRAGASEVTLRRTGGVSFRVPACIAAGLLVLSLGLPWLQTIGTAGTYLPGYVTPGFCSTSFDADGWAFSSCTPMTVSPGFPLPGTAGSVTTGASHPARFGIAWAVVLGITAIRRDRPKLLLLAGAGLGVVMTISAGVGFSTSGVCAAWLAVGALVFGALRAGAFDGVKRARLATDPV